MIKHDIDLTRGEVALAREKEFSHCLLESMADGVAACDAEGFLTLFNRAAREWHGLDPMNLPPEEWAQHYDLFRADGITPLPTNEIPLARALMGENVRDAGMAIKAKDQPIRFILANGSVIRDEAGKKLGAVVIMRDVTEFRRLEQELRSANEELEDRVARRTAELQDSRDKLEEAQRIAHIACWDRDFTANRIILADEAGRIFGISAQELVMDLEEWHRKWLMLIHPDDRERTARAASDALSGLSTYNVEYRIVRPDGEVRHIHSEANVIRDETERPIRMIGMMQDITRQKLVEEELRKLNEELEQKVKERTAELEANNSDLEKMNKIFIGRELKMVELKKRIRELENMTQERYGGENAT